MKMRVSSQPYWSLAWLVLSACQGEHYGTITPLSPPEATRAASRAPSSDQVKDAPAAQPEAPPAETQSHIVQGDEQQATPRETTPVEPGSELEDGGTQRATLKQERAQCQNALAAKESELSSRLVALNTATTNLGGCGTQLTDCQRSLDACQATARVGSGPSAQAGPVAKGGGTFIPAQDLRLLVQAAMAQQRGVKPQDIRLTESQLKAEALHELAASLAKKGAQVQGAAPVQTQVQRVQLR